MGGRVTYWDQAFLPSCIGIGIGIEIVGIAPRTLLPIRIPAVVVVAQLGPGMVVRGGGGPHLAGPAARRGAGRACVVAPLSG
jgi:hypothetical protein